MLTSQQFCVKWNSYSSNLQSVFPRLLNSEHFVDITLACEGQMIKCHKVVLSACSTYFEKLLVQNPCQHPIIFMKDMKHWEVQALVDFMYKGEVNVSQEELNSLLVAAEALQIRGLCGSDHINRQHDSNAQPSSPLSKISSVSLPSDTVLSGDTSIGQEMSQKKRKITNDENDQVASTLPRISGVATMSGNLTSIDTSAAQGAPSSNVQAKADNGDEEGEEEGNTSVIKQEVKIEGHFIEGESDADMREEDGGAEHQEDSDSNNREEIHCNVLLDQPGPSGIATTNAGEKSSTGGRWTGPVSTVVSTELDHCGLPTLQHLSSFNQSQLLEIPFASVWRGNVTPDLKTVTNQTHMQLSGQSGNNYQDAANISHGQIRVRDCIPSSAQLECNVPKLDMGINRATLHRFSSSAISGTSLDQIFDAGTHTVRPLDMNILSRNPIVNDQSHDMLLDPNCQVRQQRISRRRTEEEKALRKLELARLRQRRFRAKIRLMREAGLPVVTRERKKNVESGTDNTPS